MPRWLSFGRERSAGAGIAKTTSLAELHYAVIDTELTSLDSRRNRLLSIGAVAMDGSKIRIGDPFYRVVNPGVEVPAESVRIHKLRPADVEQGIAPQAAMAELREFIGSRVLVGHFFRIDLQALGKELGEQQHEFSNPAICTARVHRWMVQNGPLHENVHEQLKTLDLATLAREYNLEFREAHHALEDAFLTARLWQKQMARLLAMGVRDLGGLLKIGKA